MSSKANRNNVVASEVVGVDVVTSGRPLITADFDHLVAVIDSTVQFQETASNACIIELRRKLETMELTADKFGELIANVKAWQAYEKDGREYNASRMVAFGKYMSQPEIAMHVAALNFTETTKGESRCECQAFNVCDVSTSTGPRYEARFSGMFHNVTTAFHAVVKVDPAEAFEALYSENAAGELRRLYENIREADAETNGKPSTEHASGEGENVPALPENSPAWLEEAYNACNSLKRHIHAAWQTDAESAELIVPTFTKDILGMVRDIREAMEKLTAEETDDDADEVAKLEATIDAE